jgi:ParB family chromosome partitioning protein
VARKNKDIQLTSYQDLLGIEDEKKSDKDRIIELPVSELYDFKDHPFQVKDDEEMMELVESIQEYGVLNPVLVRSRSGGGFELISGHRRKRASILSDRTTMPVILREYTDDEAVIIMVNSNIQRENILPSEKAFAYKMKLDAVRHQGLKGEFIEGTADLVGKEGGDSGRNVQRYIRLTELLPKLLELVDSRKIKFMPAVTVSFLSKAEQEWVLYYVLKKGCSITGDMAEELKKHSKEGNISKVIIEQILCRNKKASVKIILPEKRLKQYFPIDYNSSQVEKIIYELLEQWSQKHLRKERISN